MEIDIDNASKSSLPNRASPGKTANESPGRELDALVAEQVMGWRWWSTKIRFTQEVRRALQHPEFENDEWWVSDGTEEPFEGDNPFIPRYSEDIAAAMEVVENLQTRGSTFQCQRWGVGCEWGVSFSGYETRSGGDAMSESLPDAICRAALATITKAETKESA